MIQKDYFNQLNLKTRSIMVLLTLVVVAGGATMVPIQVLHAQTTPAKNVTANVNASSEDTV
ncbi:MAG TPA: hypothetical protein VIR31_01505, partial [Nitrososphaeraceae archaeon]